MGSLPSSAPVASESSCTWDGPGCYPPRVMAFQNTCSVAWRNILKPSVELEATFVGALRVVRHSTNDLGDITKSFQLLQTGSDGDEKGDADLWIPTSVQRRPSNRALRKLPGTTSQESNQTTHACILSQESGMLLCDGGGRELNCEIAGPPVIPCSERDQNLQPNGVLSTCRAAFLLLASEGDEHSMYEGCTKAKCKITRILNRLGKVCGSMCGVDHL